MKTRMNWKSVSREVVISLFIVFSITGTYAALSSLTATTGESLTAAKWNELVNHATPSGAIMAFNLASCPTGWSAADGTGGNPDLRWEFIRGLDDGRWVDAGRVLASAQWDDVEPHSHPLSLVTNSSWTAGSGGQARAADQFWNPAAPDTNTYNSTGVETRPRNVAFLYCIKN